MNIFEMDSLFPETISSTRDVEVFSQCPYKWFILRCLRMRKETTNVHLEAGKEFASAMELTRTLYYKEGKSEQEAIDAGKQLLLTSYAKTYLEQNFQEPAKSPEKLVEVFERMFVEQPMSEVSIVPFTMADGSLSVEQEFRIELPFEHPETGKPLEMVCKLDMLGARGNAIFVVDEKTAKSVLKDDAKQADILRTQNQFVQYVTVANMQKERFGNLHVDMVHINKCLLKVKYSPKDCVIKPYEFKIDAWFQKTWWNNLLYLVDDMLTKYQKYRRLRNQASFEATLQDTYKDVVIFPRMYGHACSTFFSPCSLTYHCTSGNAQDLFKQDFIQGVSDKDNNYEVISLTKYKEKILKGV